jgi:hypothetical protein
VEIRRWPLFVVDQVFPLGKPAKREAVSASAAFHGGGVPSGGVAGRTSKLIVGDSRRWWWSRLRHPDFVQGPFCNLQGCGFNFYLLEGLFVICKPVLNINADILVVCGLSLLNKEKNDAVLLKNFAVCNEENLREAWVNIDGHRFGAVSPRPPRRVVDLSPV